MILSFHPCFEADVNIICPGHRPRPDDFAAVKSADAVILPQGCLKPLYEAVRENCPNVFPNYDIKFKYYGKTGQAMLFQETGAAHPKTETYINTDFFYNKYDKFHKNMPLKFPFVFKFDWGGEGENVYLVKTLDEFISVLQVAKTYEKTGQKGFLIQEYIPAQGRTLRVAAIGHIFTSYWRVQKDAEVFCSSLAKGAVIDAVSDKDVQKAGVKEAKAFCKKTGINLAGFDFLFSTNETPDETTGGSIGKKMLKPLFLEINYYFGRRGLGGSDSFYVLLNRAIIKWVNNIGLSFKPKTTNNG